MTGISKKTMIPRLIQLFFLALLPSLVLAETAEQQQARVDRLEHAVLAPCCYTEPVTIHQSEIAVKMRPLGAIQLPVGCPGGIGPHYVPRFEPS
jgi:hypothetical protein